LPCESPYKGLDVDATEGEKGAARRVPRGKSKKMALQREAIVASLNKSKSLAKAEQGSGPAISLRFNEIALGACAIFPVAIFLFRTDAIGGYPVMAKKTGISDSSLWITAVVLLAIAAWTYFKR
jgi:hypothetical protein